MNIILASDHAGFVLKECVKKYLASKNYVILDVGAHQLDKDDDYPTYMIEAATKVAKDINGDTKAIIFGLTGEGEAIVANRFPGVRAIVWYGSNDEIIKLSREHNDANILSIGSKFVDEHSAIKAIQSWLDTDFSQEERHKRRIIEIDNIE